MVAPLIAAGARTAAGGVKNARKLKTESKSSNPVRRAGLRERKRITRERTSNSEGEQTAVQNIRQETRNLRGRKGVQSHVIQALGTAKKVRESGKAVAVSIMIVSWTSPLYIMQLVFAFLSIAGVGIAMAGESFLWGILDWIGITSSIGEMFMWSGMVGSILVGTLSTLFAITLYIFRRISCFKGSSIIVLAICFGAYWIPGLNLIPWVWLWCLYVAKSQ